MSETDSLARWDRIRQLQFSGATDLNSGENADMAFYDFCVSFLHCTGAEFGKPIDSLFQQWIAQNALPYFIQYNA